jgi:hypothetical protein
MIALVAFVGFAPLSQGRAPGSPETRRYIAKLADCVVNRASHKSTKIVLGDLPIRRDDENYNLVIQHCIPRLDYGSSTLFRTYDIIFRFQLAEAFLRKDPSLSLPPLQSTPLLKHDTAERRDATEKTKAFDAALSGLGECIVRGAPEASSRLVRSEMGSSAEERAFAGIKPALSSCLDAGQTLTFSSEVLRGAVALSYYRLANAAGAGR